MFGGLGDGIGDVRAGRSEQHQLVGAAVHHVEERLHSYCCVALKESEYFLKLQLGRALLLILSQKTGNGDGRAFWSTVFM